MWSSRRDLEARLCERRVGKPVQERILRLNPNGFDPAANLRGWHPKQTLRRTVNQDVGSRQKFESIWGKGSASKIPKHWLVNVGGKRRAIPGIVFRLGPKEL